MSFLTSIALIVLSSLLLGFICKKINLPSLIGMLIVGIVFGPFFLNLISQDLLNISADLRQIALIVILTRAGLSLDLGDLKKIGRSAIMLCFVPATIEIIGYLIFTPIIVGLSLTESALLGAVMGAVSPAVVIPRMLKIKKEGYGVDKAIPQMVIAGSSCDDVFVIVLFTALLSTVSLGKIDWKITWQIPVSIILGIIVGVAVGLILSTFFTKYKIRDTVKILIFLCVSFIFIALEYATKDVVPYSGLLSVITFCVIFNRKCSETSERLSDRFEKIWVIAEILLFVMVGAEVDINYAVKNVFPVLEVVFLSLIFRICGVFLCLIKTNLNFKERLFCSLAYLPKATVQAGIGAIPLSMGLPCGKTILTFAVVAILVTAPLGAIATDFSYKKLLNRTT